MVAWNSERISLHFVKIEDDCARKYFHLYIMWYETLYEIFAWRRSILFACFERECRRMCERIHLANPLAWRITRRTTSEGREKGIGRMSLAEPGDIDRNPRNPAWIATIIVVSKVLDVRAVELASPALYSVLLTLRQEEKRKRTGEKRNVRLSPRVPEC